MIWSIWIGFVPGRPEAVGPGEDGLVVDDGVCRDVGEGFEGEAMAFFFLVDPGNEGLFDDPGAGAVKARGAAVEFVGQGEGDLGGQGLGLHGASGKGAG